MKTAFAVNIWGNSMHSCSAIMIGIQLKKIDPMSRRIVHTQSIQPSELSELWEVKQFGTDIYQINEWLIKAKINLWTLINTSIVMYLDLDVMLNLQSSHINRMWSFSQRHLRMNNLLAPRSGKKCLNGGWNILKPNIMTYKILANETRFKPTLSNFAYNCPARNTDQYYLNKVFPQFVRMPGFMGYHTSRHRCATRINNIHFLHFFGRFMPWHDSCHSCLREGGFCSYYNASKCNSIWQLQKNFWKHGENISSCRLFHRTKFMRCIV